jgi:hypothetical protein
MATAGGGPAVLLLAIGTALAAAGWWGGLFLTRHPLATEIGIVAAGVARMRTMPPGIAALRRKAAGGAS